MHRSGSLVHPLSPLFGLRAPSFGLHSSRERLSSVQLPLESTSLPPTGSASPSPTSHRPFSSARCVGASFPLTVSLLWPVLLVPFLHPQSAKSFCKRSSLRLRTARYIRFIADRRGRLATPMNPFVSLFLSLPPNEMFFLSPALFCLVSTSESSERAAVALSSG